MRRGKFIIVVGLLTGLQAMGQSVPPGGLDALAGQFVKFIRSGAREKIIVLTDKNFYISGETIWLKSWCLDSLSGHYIHQSKNLFVDLVDERDSAVSQLLFNLDNDQTDGKIVLPQSLKEGYYWLRGYTKNILKEDSNRIFVKPVYILSASNPDPRSLSHNPSSVSPQSTDTAAPRVVFYPEGGYIISGTTANIGFRARDREGNPIDVSGYVIDSRSDTVCHFHSTFSGMGRFSFDAFNPRKYVAHIIWRNKRDIAYPLPHIDQFASQLSLVSQTDQTYHMRVSQGDSLYKKNKQTFILGLSRDSLCFAASGTDMYEVDVPKSSFPQGVATLFLFDDQFRVVSQRALYIPRMDSIIASTDKASYQARQKVELTAGVENTLNNHSVPATLVISVVDEKFTSMEDSPPAAGEIFQQAEYQPGLLSGEQADLVMMTRDDLYANWQYGRDQSGTAVNKENFDDVSMLNVSGHISSMKNEPLKNYIVNLFSQDNRIFKIDTTNDKGQFMIPLSDFEDGTQFNLKLTNIKGQGQEGKVVVDKYDYPQFKTPRQLKKVFDQSQIALIRKVKTLLMEDTTQFSGTHTMKTVTVEQNKVNYDASKRVNQFSYIIPSDRLVTGDPNSLVNAISAVPGFNAGVSTMRFSTATNGGSYGVQPLIILDGVILSVSTDVKTFLQTFDPSNIDFIEVLSGPQAAMYGLQGAGGVILINTTNTRKQVSQFNDRGLATIYPKGYSKVSAFPIPPYGDKDKSKQTTADLRTTIFWNGDVNAVDKNKSTVQFFTSDVKTNYVITLQALTGDGSVLFQEKRIKGF